MSFDVDRVSEEMKLNVRQMFQLQQRRGGSRHKPARKLVRFRVSSELSLILCLKKSNFTKPASWTRTCASAITTGGMGVSAGKIQINTSLILWLISSCWL